MKRVVWTANAQRDVRKIATFYGQFAPDLPDRLIADIERATLILLDFPHLGLTVAESALRRWRASGTPFLLFYRVSDNGVRVLQVRDARSDWMPA